MFGVRPCLLRVQPSNCLLPPQFAIYGTRIRDMEVYDDDVWIISYPRTGSHWAQEMVWCIGNNFNYENAQTLLLLRNPLLESSSLMVTGSYVDFFAKLGDSVQNVENTPRPRYIKSHLPRDLLPLDLFRKKPKIIYVSRNPKDTCVSFYHFCRMFNDMTGSFEEFAELFLKGYVPLGDYWSHVLTFWEMRKEENVLFLTYEEMKKDQARAIKRTASFLGKTVTDEQISELREHLKFSKMAANPATNMSCVFSPNDVPIKDDSNVKFIRKGQVGDWRNYMSDDLSQRFDEWIDRNSHGTGLKFETEGTGCDEE